MIWFVSGRNVLISFLGCAQAWHRHQPLQQPKSNMRKNPKSTDYSKITVNLYDFPLPFPSILAQRQFLAYRPPPLLGDLVQFLCMVLVCFQGLEEHAGVEEAV